MIAASSVAKRFRDDPALLPPIDIEAERPTRVRTPLGEFYEDIWRPLLRRRRRAAIEAGKLEAKAAFFPYPIPAPVVSHAGEFNPFGAPFSLLNDGELAVLTKMREQAVLQKGRNIRTRKTRRQTTTPLTEKLNEFFVRISYEVLVEFLPGWTKARVRGAIKGLLEKCVIEIWDADKNEARGRRGKVEQGPIICSQTMYRLLPFGETLERLRQQGDVIETHIPLANHGRTFHVYGRGKRIVRTSTHLAVRFLVETDSALHREPSSVTLVTDETRVESTHAPSAPLSSGERTSDIDVSRQSSNSEITKLSDGETTAGCGAPDVVPTTAVTPEVIPEVSLEPEVEVIDEWDDEHLSLKIADKFTGPDPLIDDLIRKVRREAQLQGERITNQEIYNFMVEVNANERARHYCSWWMGTLVKRMSMWVRQARLNRKRRRIDDERSLLAAAEIGDKLWISDLKRRDKEFYEEMCRKHATRLGWLLVGTDSS